VIDLLILSLVFRLGFDRRLPRAKSHKVSFSAAAVFLYVTVEPPKKAVVSFLGTKLDPT